MPEFRVLTWQANQATNRAVGVQDDDAVSHAGEDRALDIELEAPLGQQRVHDRLTADALS